MENKNNLIPEEQLEQVAGGVSTAGMYLTSEWTEACNSYECKICGTRSPMLTGHGAGCAVAAFGRPKTGGEYAATGKREMNACWSCKCAVRGEDSALYCSNGMI